MNLLAVDHVLMSWVDAYLPCCAFSRLLSLRRITYSVLVLRKRCIPQSVHCNALMLFTISDTGCYFRSDPSYLPSCYGFSGSPGNTLLSTRTMPYAAHVIRRRPVELMTIKLHIIIDNECPFHFIRGLHFRGVYWYQYLSTRDTYQGNPDTRYQIYQRLARHNPLLNPI